MESILGLSARYIPPDTARAKLKHVTEDREKLDEKFKQKIEVRSKSIQTTKDLEVSSICSHVCIDFCLHLIKIIGKI